VWSIDFHTLDYLDYKLSEDPPKKKERTAQDDSRALGKQATTSTQSSNTASILTVRTNGLHLLVVPTRVAFEEKF
jgi:hypothetical protein